MQEGAIESINGGKRWKERVGGQVKGNIAEMGKGDMRNT